ncbi:hypothetical protein HMPREF1383_01587 [Enterococcus faecium V689]|uniref:Uncharacterized protein n=1 Tax=Enterococcus faecium R496 TaxID=1134836 RepID=A0AAV3GXY0_ENTFC|nr:hypothetical protein HMPREF9523_00787 [Enterococcus faecium TX0133A]EFR78456.1 hypothetical protein HMPREF9527_00733 [Enterococcus faecium TX0133C]EJX41035.1 hypothetical protein HMPREF1383_01587 [Enterococcus faecium V689]EJX50582.1 hypothetical protein HMPREF1380_00864 [Enterococcus faecium R499]EJX54659.1 hypothetical protein HMPREF1378_00674 [Enterococcus faecium R496]EJX64422.1 hypothetical protein HMPREF1376_00759 [Enterococcus faecium R446]EJX79708.1 hypothetical protein HMPREF1372_
MVDEPRLCETNNNYNRLFIYFNPSYLLLKKQKLKQCKRLLKIVGYGIK